MTDPFDQWRKDYLTGLDAFWREESIRIANDLKVAEAKRKAKYEDFAWVETTANERWYQGLWPYD